MRKVAKLISIVGILALSVSVAGARGGGVGTNDCGDGEGGHELTWSPTVVWPPNHKYQDITITYSDESAEHQLMLAATGATHDEIDPDSGEELGGSGNTGDDVVLPADAATGTGEVSIVVRARGERSGKGDGRVYTIDYTATSMDENGTDNDCSGQVTVTVPHDCRQGACDVTKQNKKGDATSKARGKNK